MTADEKLKYIQDQFDKIWTEGRELAVDCPYCYTRVEPGETVCCPLMALAAQALIERAKLVEEGLEKFERRQFGKQIMGGAYLN